ncbi:hypothetical protein DPEC_G00237480 [Dallia pectoralis]|uniref:Uncharacterized protein n=1 Tax=Dallia pectoralis TaxID=75939 RepID=A0ACC2FYP9_DALPE|nr:hypothetical protein DPEC_G00237480 [Dallia pectoralis]
MEATDLSLFIVNICTGEVRTKRAVSEQDDSYHRLVIEVKDNGNPAQSTTTTVNILIEDRLHKPITDFRKKTVEPNKRTSQITFYLIISLASVSVLSFFTFLILVVQCVRNSMNSSSCCIRRADSNGYKNPNRNLQIQLNTDGPIKYVEVLGGDMMSQSQSFRSCLSPMSEFSDFTLVKPSSTTDFKNMINVLDASLPDSAWTFESQQCELSFCVALSTLVALKRSTLSRVVRLHRMYSLSKLVEATDLSLFSVNIYTGEVRTKRAVSEQDDTSQSLVIEVKDNGNPPQSATVTVNILLEDGLHEPITDFHKKTVEPNKRTSQITFYLIISLASVSVLSFFTFLILVVKCIRNSRSNSSCCIRRADSDGYKNPNRNLQIQLNTDGPIKYVEVLGGDMMSQSQSFRSCLSPMSEFSDFTLVKPSSPTDFKDMINVLDASLPDSAWTFESQQCVRNSMNSSNCCIRRADSNGYKNPNRNLQIQLNTDGPINGHNAWLFYSLAGRDAGLFHVGTHSGEVRTARRFQEEESAFAVVVLVQDNGQPTLSTSVPINITVTENVPILSTQIRRESSSRSRSGSALKLALIGCLACVCFVCLLAIVALGMQMRCRGFPTCLGLFSGKAPHPCSHKDLHLQLNTDGPLSYVEVVEGSQSLSSYPTLSSSVRDFVFVKSPVLNQNTLSVTLSNKHTSKVKQKPPNNDWRFNQQAQRPGPSGQYTLIPHYSTHRSSHTGFTDRLNNGTYRLGGTQQRWTPYDKARAGPHPEGAGGVVAGTGPWPNPPTEAEQLHALIAAANEVSEATATLRPPYNAQFPMQHVPDYRQNVYIPGSTATLTANPQQMMPQQVMAQQALQGPPQARPQAEVPKAAQTPASKKKSTKKDKK